MTEGRKAIVKKCHGSGLSDVCHDSSGEMMITCGNDGFVKVFPIKSIIEDEKCEPSTSISCGSKVSSVAVSGNDLFVAADNYMVEKYSINEDFQLQSTVLRFTGDVTYMSVCNSWLAAGSSDFEIKCYNIETKKQKILLGHQAPILSAQVCPLDTYVVSVSCDGKAKIWMLDTQKCVETLDNIVEKSNDVCNSSSYCRLAWRPSTGEDFAIPGENGVKLFARDTWQQLFELKCEKEADAIFHCVTFSPCGRFLSAGSSTSKIICWDVETQQVMKSFNANGSAVCSIEWNPINDDSIAFTNMDGNVGFLCKIMDANTEDENNTENKKSKMDELFDKSDDDIDDVMIDFPVTAVDDVTSNQDAPDAEVTQKKKKSRFLDDEAESDDDDMMPATPPLPSGGGIESSVAVAGGVDAAGVVAGKIEQQQRIAAEILEEEKPQEAFQPGATPTSLPHRFMTYNNVGIVRCYNDDIDRAIDVEFHETSLHHAIHIVNECGYIMASLSTHALVLATGEDSVDNEGEGVTSSRLYCNNFTTFDNNKEWTMDLPKDEFIMNVTTGGEWIAVFTSLRYIRFFSLGGVQKEIICCPGDVITMTSFTDHLFVAYHAGRGHGNEHLVNYMLINIDEGVIIRKDQLPLSPCSTLQWAGYSTEGLLFTQDSDGIVRMLNHKFIWNTVAHTMDMVSSSGDFMFIIGVHEDQMRHIMCRGSTFPPTLPKPIQQMTTLKLPYLEMKTDKGKFEEDYWRKNLLLDNQNYLQQSGYDIDEENVNKMKTELRQKLMMMFAHACQNDKDNQALDIARMIPDVATLNLAVKYASRTRKMPLAEKISKIVAEKTRVDEMMLQEDDDDDDVIMESESQNSTNSSVHRIRPSVRLSRNSQDFISATPDLQLDESATSGGGGGGRRRSFNPFKKSSRSNKPSSVTSSHEDGDNMAPSSGSGGDKNVLDSITRSGFESKKSDKKSSAITSSTNQQNSTKTAVKSSGKTQRSLMNIFKKTSTNGKSETNGTNGKSETNGKNETNGTSKKTYSKQETAKHRTIALNKFIRQNLPDVSEENPENDEAENRKIIIQKFRKLQPQVKQRLLEEAAATCNGSGENGATKRANCDDVSEQPASKKLLTED